MSCFVSVIGILSCCGLCRHYGHCLRQWLAERGYLEAVFSCPAVPMIHLVLSRLEGVDIRELFNVRELVFCWQ